MTEYRNLLSKEQLTAWERNRLNKMILALKDVDLSEPPCCPTCGKEIEFTTKTKADLKTSVGGWKTYCSRKCSKKWEIRADNKFKAALNHLGIMTAPVCKQCGKGVEFTSQYHVTDDDRKTPFGGWREFCSIKCMHNNEEIIKKKEETSISLYGYSHWSKNPEIAKNHYHNNVLPVIKEKYGVSNMGFLNDRDSSNEREVYEFCESLGVKVIRSYRELPSGREIDILFPEHNIGIEVNGDYWHSELFHNSSYHKEKYEEAFSFGIKLIQIFVTEWNEKKSIVKSLIRNLVCGSSHKYARNTISRRISLKEANDFLDDTHIRGGRRIGDCYGLFLEGVIVSVMVFEPPKKNTFRKTWEITRFASSSVIGAFGKLLSKFILDNPCVCGVHSFLDLRFGSEGSNVYIKNGFLETSRLKPDYMYFYKGKLVHKFSMRKKALLKLGAKGVTEHDMAKSIGAIRVYDAGKICYEKHFTSS